MTFAKKSKVLRLEDVMDDFINQEQELTLRDNGCCTMPLHHFLDDHQQTFSKRPAQDLQSKAHRRKKSVVDFTTCSKSRKPSRERSQTQSPIVWNNALQPNG